ncbi:hypothetical protein VNO77_11430 [Canavalia gladiata]|uniref:Uncharacterized protein n=1 Tax=Canavalia gladiata TaxID=3824 RepID=A0AAN9QYC6_CANGL
MKQGKCMASSCRSRESEVAEILVNLPTLIWEFEYSRPILPPGWGHKRKRSTITVPHKPDPSSSPATPFSFSPSDSDHTRFTPNLSLKTKKEHYLNIIQQLTKDNDLLSREMKNVRCYFDKLKDFNLKLKSRKEELSRGPNQGHLVRKQPQLQFPSMAHHTPLMVNRTAWTPLIGDGGAREACGQATTSLGVPSFCGGELGLGKADINNDVGPIGIPDLNVPLEESMGGEEWCEALDVSVSVANSRAVAAQARQNRLHIYRLKNPIANSKTRYSCR